MARLVVADVLEHPELTGPLLLDGLTDLLRGQDEATLARGGGAQLKGPRVVGAGGAVVVVAAGAGRAAKPVSKQNASNITKREESYL